MFRRNRRQTDPARLAAALAAVSAEERRKRAIAEVEAERARLRVLDQARFDTVGLPAPTPAVALDYMVGRTLDRSL